MIERDDFGRPCKKHKKGNIPDGGDDEGTSPLLAAVVLICIFCLGCSGLFILGTVKCAMNKLIM